MKDTTIERVELVRLHGRMPVERDLDAAEELVAPYGKWRPEGLTLGSRLEKSEIPVKHTYLRILTKDGHEGLCLGVTPVGRQLLNDMAPAFLLGRDSLDTEHIWQHVHGSARFGVRGEHLTALAAIDIALWDLRGKAMGVPTAAAMGGTRRKTVSAYGMLDGLPGLGDDDYGRIREWAVYLKEKGYRYTKWPVPVKNNNQLESFKWSVGYVRTLREALGDDADFILCAFMGKQSKAFFKAVEPYAPMHIQTCVAKGDETTLAELRTISSVPIGTGQDVRDRRDLLRLLNGGQVDVLGCDPFGVGGLTELRKIAHVVEAYGAQMWPHCTLLENTQLVASLPGAVCPFVERLIAWSPYRLFFEVCNSEPKNGTITVPDHPGIYCWHEDRIEKRELVAEWDRS